MVASMKADATYGTSCCMRFDEQNEYHYERDPYSARNENNEPICINLFQAIVKVGERVSNDQVYTATYCPFNRTDTRATFTLYRTLREEVDYTVDEENKCPADLEILGTITIPMPDPMRRANRSVELMFDFSQTEILVMGRDETSGKIVKAVMDFL